MSVRSVRARKDGATRIAADLPSPAEVRRRCAQIQRGWTPDERSVRTVIKGAVWRIPTIKIADLGVERRTSSSP